jgi:hypothetical protein
VEDIPGIPLWLLGRGYPWNPPVAIGWRISLESPWRISIRYNCDIPRSLSSLVFETNVVDIVFWPFNSFYFVFKSSYVQEVYLLMENLHVILADLLCLLPNAP